MTAAQLSPPAVQALEEARVLLRETTGFMYLPVFAPSERAAGLTMDALRPALSGEPFRVAWPPTRPAPSDTALAAVDLASDRAQLLQNLDNAIASLPENSVLVLNATGTTRTPLALHMPAYLNLRREPLRTAKLRFLLFWPAAHRETLMAGAPDLWSMRAASPWADEIEYVESEPGNTSERLFATPIAAVAEALSPPMARSLQSWQMHRNLRDANLSLQDALALVKALHAIHHFSDALELAEFIQRQLADDPTTERNSARPSGAKSLLWTSMLRSALGDRQAALGPAREAVTIYRSLAEADPAAHEPDLAGSLVNLSNRLSSLGERKGALNAALEATAIYRRLAGTNPAIYDRDLAASLNNLANDLREMGERASALGPSTEAIAIYRRLAAANPSANEPDLAASLSNMAINASNLSEAETALALGQEAAAIWRRLADSKPGLYEPAFARSLSNLAGFMRRAGRQAEALAPAQAAVDIHRRLARANPSTHEPGLANSLGTGMQCFASVGDTETARAMGNEALAVFARLAQAHPKVFEQLRDDTARQLAVLRGLNGTGHDVSRQPRVGPA